MLQSLFKSTLVYILAIPYFSKKEAVCKAERRYLAGLRKQTRLKQVPKPQTYRQGFLNSNGCLPDLHNATRRRDVLQERVDQDDLLAQGFRSIDLHSSWLGTSPLWRLLGVPMPRLVDSGSMAEG